LAAGSGARGGSWVVDSLVNGPNNYFTYMDYYDPFNIKNLRKDKSLGWQWEPARVFNWIGGAPFLVLYGAPYLLFNGVGALILEPDPFAEKRKANKKEIVIFLSDTLGSQRNNADNLQQQAREHLANANNKRVHISLGKWQMSYKLQFDPNAFPNIPSLPNDSVHHSQSFMNNLQDLKKAKPEILVKLDNLNSRFKDIMKDDIKNHLADFVDTALSKAGIAIRVGSIYKFRKERKCYVGPAANFLNKTLPLIPCAFTNHYDNEHISNGTRFENTMTQKTGVKE